MLNKLRNKFVLINTLMIGAILVLIVLAISALTLRREFVQTENALKSVVSLNYENAEISGVLLAHVDENGNITVIENEISTQHFNTKNLTLYVNDILSIADKSDGLLIKHRILYRRVEMQDGTYVAFASLDGILLSTEDAFSTSSSVAAIALFLLFLLSRKLSKVVIKPAENAWSDQKRFIADASHDLKTPLTVIMANNDILLAHPEKTVAEQQKWLESTRQETEYMSSLINKMLELAKTDSLLEKIQLDNVNISEVVEKAVLQLEPVAFEGGVIIQADITKDIVSRSNSTELYKLTQILIDNAVKYAPCDSTVMVSLARSKKEIIFSVNNKGDIIPSEQLEHIFDRFYRTDDARTKGGFGLGLSIAKNVANALGGEIFATSDDNGTTFTVKFKE